MFVSDLSRSFPVFRVFNLLSVDLSTCDFTSLSIFSASYYSPLSWSLPILFLNLFDSKKACLCTFSFLSSATKFSDLPSHFRSITCYALPLLLLSLLARVRWQPLLLAAVAPICRCAYLFSSSHIPFHLLIDWLPFASFSCYHPNIRHAVCSTSYSTCTFRFSFTPSNWTTISTTSWARCRNHFFSNRFFGKGIWCTVYQDPDVTVFFSGIYDSWERW